MAIPTVVEALAIRAYAIGAKRGFSTFGPIPARGSAAQVAIQQAEERGLLETTSSALTTASISRQLGAAPSSAARERP